MRTATLTRPLAVLTALLALIVCVTVPAARADSRIVLERGHTDAFYVVIKDGVPEVLVANVRDYYTPDDTVFRIQASTYSAEHELMGPFDGPAEGYSSVALENGWFEPGWSAPGFHDVFESLRVDFTQVTGPGRALIVGNSPLDEEGEENGARAAFLADGTYDVIPGSSLPILGHTHAHWFFTHAGEYQLTGHAVGTKADGQEVTSKPFTVTFRVERNEQDTRGAAPAQPSTEPSTTPEPTTPPAVEPSTAPSTQPGTSPTAGPSAPSASVFDTNEPYRLTQGHVDLFSVVAHNGALVMAAKDESTGKMVVRQPEDVTVVVSENTRRDFSGQVASTLVSSGYFLPESGQNQQEAPFPGWDSFSAEPEFPAVDLQFVDVTGPGRVFLFSTARRGLSSQLVSGSYELNDGEVIRMSSPSHVHTNWLFEKPGTYTMTVRTTGVSSETGQTVTSQPATYTWVVGETAPEPTPSATPSSTATAGTATEPTAAPSDLPTGAPAPSSTADAEPTSASSDQPMGAATPGSTTTAGSAGVPSATGNPSATPSATGNPSATPSATTSGAARPPVGGGAVGGGDLGGGSGAGGPGLARTGAETMTLIGLSLAILTGGSAFLAARRREA
ncbi:choice-of-anchor M domain-containing protein [Actinomyces respiraculi]|uniref:choice-of-anchor M domain-containing protein n=1 Tax=Actinomyces respiraculi TaxID=2744574 RepID=UPI00141FDBBE|nr:choice-of-anchor M domain-containing protein [Actinomyces respiraculi]